MSTPPLAQAGSEPEDHRPTWVRTTGVGSMPGTSATEAAAISAGEFDIPFLPELPERGPGADMVGRTLALVHDVTGEFAGTTTPTGWQLSVARAGGEPGRAMRRGRSWLGEDLDAFEAELLTFTGTVKVAVAGPWTLAAAVEDRSGNRLLADRGACLELSEALAVSATTLLGWTRRRVPAAAEVVVQFDEPLLPNVVAGRVPTPSGRGRLPVPEEPDLESVLGTVVSAVRLAGAVPAVHSCARSVPFELAARCGVEVMSVDVAAVGAGAQDAMAAWWDRGGTLALGVLPAMAVPAATSPGSAAGATGVARNVAGLWSRIGFAPDVVGPRTILTPSCGLAGASPQWARAVGAQLRRAARMLGEAD